ncbi:SepM family pheromone-processing serine protease, partial [Bombilactobacillus bombi]|uniref:SepM family pheromone-processing serine protease n=1 Tax=Bombilactobacillus bombi TaxID=1303590 RepID=UPI0015E5C272
MKKHRKLVISLSVIAVLLFIFLPLPYFIEAPGTAQPTADTITVDHQHDQRSGKFLFTTVELSSATPLSMIRAAVDPFREIDSRQEVMGGDNTKEYLQMQNYFMENASNNAIEAAFKKAQRPYQKKYLGIYVMSILKHSHFKNHLQVGDVVSEIDGHRFLSSQSFINYVKSQKVNQHVNVKYQRHQHTYQTRQRLMAMNKKKKPGLGISLVDHVQVHTQPNVKINAGDIGGPSAGLMFSLQIYTQLTHQNLTKGRIIAGTGTISPHGK